MQKVISLIAVLMFATGVFSQETDSLKVENISLEENITTVEENPSLIQVVEKWYEENTNYYTITALMAVESSFIPFPSEIVIPPAAYIAGKENSDLNIYLVVAFGTLGALIGALINYFLALWLGRPIMYKFAESKVGRLCLLSKEKIQQKRLRYARCYRLLG